MSDFFPAISGDEILTAFGPVPLRDVEERLIPDDWALVLEGVPFVNGADALWAHRHLLMAERKPSWWDAMKRATVAATEISRERWQLGRMPWQQRGDACGNRPA